MEKNVVESNVIRRVKKESQFAQISNEIINNKGLSYKALGILTYILAKPDDWQVYMSDLIREGVDGEKSVRNGLNELIEKKYVQRYRVYNKTTGKVHHWETLVSETPFDDNELISSVKEEYVLDKEDKIVYQKITLGSFERYVPMVLNREVTLLSQNGNVEKKEEKITTLPKGTSRKPTSRKGSTTNTNITNTDFLTNTEFSNSSSKGNTPAPIHPLVEMFNESICELKKTTTPKFMSYVEKYDSKFIETIIAYCETQGAKSYTYFARTIESYISKDILTAEDLEQSIQGYYDEMKESKKRALQDKDKKKKEAQVNSLGDVVIDSMIDGVDDKVEISEEAEDLGYIKNLMASQISEVSFNTWIAPLEIKKSNNKILVCCPNQFTRDIVEQRYYDIITSTVKTQNINGLVSIVIPA